MAEEKSIPQASIQSDSEKQIGRKGFISWLTLGWLAFAAATGGFWLSMWEILPEVVSLAIGVLTLVYLILKIKKEVK